MGDPRGSQKPGTGHECLHAPWRMSYMQLLSSKDREESGGGAEQKAVCFLRDYWFHPERDGANFVITRTGREDVNDGRGGMILLNRYPYSNGHLLVALGRSRMRLLDYSEEERRELWSLVDLAVELCEKALGCQGVNVGINQGDAAGAGVPEHLHAHVVPRWGGDTNFITTVGRIRVIPSALEAMYQRYAEVWEQIRNNPSR